MRTRSHVLALAMAAVLAFTGVACGDDDDGGNGAAPGAAGGGDAPAVSEESRPYVDALKKAMREANEEDGAVAMTDDQIDCLAPRWINTIGVETLEKNDVTAEDMAENSDLMFEDLGLSEDQGNEMYDGFGDCGLNLRDLIVEQMAGDDDVSDAARACMEGVFTDENLRTFMVSSLVHGDDGMEDDPAVAPIVGQMMGCAFMGMGDAEGGGGSAEFNEVGSSIAG